VLGNLLSSREAAMEETNVQDKKQLSLWAALRLAAA
jgi:hypothetical protein